MLEQICQVNIVTYMHVIITTGLYQGSQQLQWLINPHPADTSYVFYVDGPGYLGNAGAGASVTNANAYSPVMALKSDITVTGSGTQSDPYVMN